MNRFQVSADMQRKSFETKWAGLCF